MCATMFGKLKIKYIEKFKNQSDSGKKLRFVFQLSTKLSKLSVKQIYKISLI